MKKIIRAIAITICVCLLITPLAAVTSPVRGSVDPKQEYEKKLKIQPGEKGLDATLGYGGHTKAMLEKLCGESVEDGTAQVQAGQGYMVALDVDPIEIVKTKERLNAAGYGEDVLNDKEILSTNEENKQNENPPQSEENNNKETESQKTHIETETEKEKENEKEKEKEKEESENNNFYISKLPEARRNK